AISTGGGCGGGGGGGSGGNFIGAGGRNNLASTHTNGNWAAASNNRARAMGDLAIPAFRPRGIPPDEVVDLALSDTASSSSGSSDSESGFIPLTSTSDPAGRSLRKPPGAAGGRLGGKDKGESEDSDSGFIPFLRPSGAAAGGAAAAAAAPSRVGKAKAKAKGKAKPPPRQLPVAKFSSSHRPRPSASGALQEQ
ncbi:unnamed protein product, partial [Laminaria digitata]